MAADTDDTDTSELAREVIKELDPGTIVEDKIVISRRMAILVATGTVSAGALLGYGSGTASADVVGQVGTSADRVDVFAGTVDATDITITQLGSSSSPVDVFASGNGNVELEGDVTSTSVTGGFELTVDGDTYQFNK